MSNNNIDNNWIDAIKSRANQATRDVPQGTWEAIAKEMAQQPSSVAKKHATITPRLWKATAAAAAVALVVTTGYFIAGTDSNQPQQPVHIAQHSSTPAAQHDNAKPSEDESAAQPTQPATAQPAATQPSSTIPTINNKSLLAHNTATPSHHTGSAPKSHHATNRHGHSNNRHTATTPTHDGILNDQLLASNDNELIDLAQYPNEFNPEDYFYDVQTMQALEELYASYDNSMNQEAMEPWKAYTDSTYQQHLVYDANARRAAREKMALTKRHKQSTMLLAAYGNGLISGDNESTVNGSSAALLAPAASNPPMMMAPGTNGNKVAPPVNYTYHHHMPLTAGLAFNKRIVRNLYGTIGLNFTSMSSDVTPDNGAPKFKQKVMLVGLPLGVKWNFWRYKGLSTFVGGEALVERVVSAKFNNESLTIKRLQWSVHATAGIQYNFNRHVGIYLSPKLSHYITTMPLNTLRNEHPLNFNLQLGLSLDF